jgi:enamine deaminase RidA (YjgF/YER057c/UK114 family)
LEEETTMTTRRTLQPEGWPRPKGYANGILAEGRTVWIAGQVGWDTAGNFADSFVAQFEQALRNIVAILAEAGGKPEHLVRLTWYVTDMVQYETSLREIGAAYGRVIGRNFPTMTVVQVTRLVEPPALVEIEANAVLP